MLGQPAPLDSHLKGWPFTATVVVATTTMANNNVAGPHPEHTAVVRGGLGAGCGERGMDIQDMRIFARVAAVQNLSAVGTELGLTPGTISKRIQSLEDELSARLFDRTTRSIRITEEGVAFLAHVERILSEIEAARASVDDK